MLGLAKAGSGVTGGTAAGFSLIDSTFRNYDESFLVDANIAKMRRLGHAAQDDMKVRMDANPPANIFRAESRILRYSGLCSFLGMQDLLDSSIHELFMNFDYVLLVCLVVELFSTLAVTTSCAGVEDFLSDDILPPQGDPPNPAPEIDRSPDSPDDLRRVKPVRRVGDEAPPPPP